MTIAVAARGELLYDSGRVPLWLRVPCLLLALLCLAMLFDSLAIGLLGRPMFFFPPADLPLGWLAAVAGTGGLAAFMLQIWVGRKRIFWDSERRELRTEDRWLIGIHRLHLAQADAAAVRVRQGKIRASTFWDVSLLDSSGRETWLTREYTAGQGKSLGERIAAAIDRPLESAEPGAPPASA